LAPKSIASKNLSIVKKIISALTSPSTPIVLNYSGISILRVFASIVNTGSSNGKIEKYFYQYFESPPSGASSSSSFSKAASII
jgi:hypothetical protein